MSGQILITGATGTIGQSLVHQMAEAGVKAKALVRNPQKAEAINLGGMELVEGDFEKPETLAHALEGVEKLFLNSSPDPRIVELQHNVIEAARRAGVRHVIKLSAIDASSNPAVSLIRWHAQIERELEGSGLAYTHLRPNGFMQNTLMFAQTVREQGAFYAPLGETRVSYVDARDIAAVALATLTEEGHEGRAYDLTGPEALSYDDVARKLSAATGKEVRYVNVPYDAARQGMKGAGLPDWLADALIELYQFYSRGGGEVVSNDIRNVLGREATTFDQFARDYAKAFA